MVNSGKLFGTYSHNVDSKGRLMLPKKLQCQQGEVLFLVRGYEGCIEIHTEESFNKLFELVNSLQQTQRSARLHTRLTIGQSIDTVVDGQGRIQIPSRLLQAYGITKEVYLIGAITHYELWDKAKFDQYVKNNEDTFEDNAQTLLGGD